MQRTIDGLCVTIVRKSIKNMHLRVLSPDGEIQITAPNRLPLSQIDRFVREKRGWIEARQQQLAARPAATDPAFVDGQTVYLWGAQVQTMMPKLHSTNFPGMELIRPMYLIREDDIKAWRDANDLHFIQCACRFTDTCTTCRPNEEAKSKRQQTKQLIRELKKTNPEVEAHIFRSMENVCLDTVIAYKTGGRKISFLENYDRPRKSGETE